MAGDGFTSVSRKPPGPYAWRCPNCSSPKGNTDPATGAVYNGAVRSVQELPPRPHRPGLRQIRHERQKRRPVRKMGRLRPQTDPRAPSSQDYSQVSRRPFPTDPRHAEAARHKARCRKEEGGRCRGEARCSNSNSSTSSSTRSSRSNSSSSTSTWSSSRSFVVTQFYARFKNPPGQ